MSEVEEIWASDTLKRSKAELLKDPAYQDELNFIFKTFEKQKKFMVDYYENGQGRKNMEGLINFAFNKLINAQIGDLNASLRKDKNPHVQLMLKSLKAGKGYEDMRIKDAIVDLIKKASIDFLEHSAEDIKAAKIQGIDLSTQGASWDPNTNTINFPLSLFRNGTIFGYDSANETLKHEFEHIVSHAFREHLWTLGQKAHKSASKPAGILLSMLASVLVGSLRWNPEKENFAVPWEGLYHDVVVNFELSSNIEKLRKIYGDYPDRPIDLRRSTRQYYNSPEERRAYAKAWQLQFPGTKITPGVVSAICQLRATLVRGFDKSIWQPFVDAVTKEINSIPGLEHVKQSQWEKLHYHDPNQPWACTDPVGTAEAINTLARVTITTKTPTTAE